MKVGDIKAIMSAPMTDSEEMPMESPKEESAELASYSDEDLIEELERRGFEVEKEEMEAEAENEMMAEEEIE